MRFVAEYLDPCIVKPDAINNLPMEPLVLLGSHGITLPRIKMQIGPIERPLKSAS